MDPVSLIVAALAAGAVAGAEGTTTAAVKDAYAGLKTLVMRRFGGRDAGGVALEQHRTSPEQWRSALEAELVRADAGTDSAVVQAAQRLMALVDARGSQQGTYLVDVSGSHGVQVGDHNTQTNTFATPPST